MGLFGFTLQVLVNLALGHSDAYYGTATLGILVFCGLASYHAQNIRNFEWEFDDDDTAQDKAAAGMRRNDLLSRYDRNQNGSIDPEERPPALDFPPSPALG